METTKLTMQEVKRAYWLAFPTCRTEREPVPEVVLDTDSGQITPTGKPQRWPSKKVRTRRVKRVALDRSKAPSFKAWVRSAYSNDEREVSPKLAQILGRASRETAARREREVAARRVRQAKAAAMRVSRVSKPKTEEKKKGGDKKAKHG